MLHLLVNELTGPLPRDLIGLPLMSFLWNQTDLCAPTDSAFQEWLDSIEVHWSNGNCDSGSPAARPRLAVRGQSRPSTESGEAPGWQGANEGGIAALFAQGATQSAALEWQNV